MRSLILLFLLVTCGARAQEFPADFTGHWEGELEWFQPGKKMPKKVKMQLIILPSDSANIYSWNLIYGEKNEDNRPYLLKRVDTSQFHWIIDERNGIVLDYYWIGKHFTGTFTVQSSTIFNQFYLNGNNLVAEFYSITAKPISTTGKGNEDIPFVNSYAARAYQKAILQKKKG